jgi:hypothetical protein
MIVDGALGQNSPATSLQIKISDDLRLAESDAVRVTCLTDKLPQELPMDSDPVPVSFLIKNLSNETVTVDWTGTPPAARLYTIGPAGRRKGLFAPFPTPDPGIGYEIAGRVSFLSVNLLKPNESTTFKVNIPANVLLRTEGLSIVAGIECSGYTEGPFYAFSRPFKFPAFKVKRQ